MEAFEAFGEALVAGAEGFGVVGGGFEVNGTQCLRYLGVLCM